jgi:hypothetical protein
MKEENPSTLFVCFHKEEIPIQLEGIQPIYVGNKELLEQGVVSDRTGDHIHEKNDRYGELTALYWIWKNYKGYEFVGICHYRRYFLNPTRPYFYPTQIHRNELEENKQLVTPMSEKWLCNADIVLPSVVKLCNPVGLEYNKYHSAEDLKLMRIVLLELSPNYVSAWDKFIQGNNVYLYNIFIARSELYDAYCTWLFRLLFRFDELDTLARPNSYQSRINGFLAERLLNVFVTHNNLRIKEIPIVFIGEKSISRWNFWQNIKDVIKNFIFWINGLAKSK